jgi:hypothetical protein
MAESAWGAENGEIREDSKSIQWTRYMIVRNMRMSRKTPECIFMRGTVIDLHMESDKFKTLVTHKEQQHSIS